MQMSVILFRQLFHSFFLYFRYRKEEKEKKVKRKFEEIFFLIFILFFLKFPEGKLNYLCKEKERKKIVREERGIFLYMQY